MAGQVRYQTDNETRAIFGVCALILLLLLSGCARKTSIQLATEKMSPGWNVQIIEVSEPELAMVLQHEPMIGPPMGVPRKPFDENMKWLVIKLKVTPAQLKAEPTPTPSNSGVPGGVPTLGGPEAETSTGPTVVAVKKFANIQLISSSGEAYSAEALATGGRWKDNNGSEMQEFLDPKDSQDVFKNASGEIQMALSSGMLEFYKPGPQELVLLFAVPKRAPSLSLWL
jgi:hypothetical protein